MISLKDIEIGDCFRQSDNVWLVLDNSRRAFVLCQNTSGKIVELFNWYIVSIVSLEEFCGLENHELN